MSTAELIRDRRGDLGLTVVTVAEYVGVTTEAVRLWQNGHRHPRPRYARRLEHVLQLPAGALNNENEAAATSATTS